MLALTGAKSDCAHHNRCRYRLCPNAHSFGSPFHSCSDRGGAAVWWKSANSTLYFLFAAVLLIAFLALSLRFPPSPAQFALPAALFIVFGMWAAQSAVLHSPHELQRFLNKEPVSYIAEVTAPPEYYPDKIRIPLAILWAIDGPNQDSAGCRSSPDCFERK